MPLRRIDRNRSTAEVLGARLEDVVPLTHPVRFVARLIEELDAATWEELGIDPAGQRLGAPAFPPVVLTAVWVYGFMSGVRTSRGLETACREQVPLLWLTGGQTPDHNTLWRFYQRHRARMRAVFRRTVTLAVETGYVEWAVQAVDGTKVRANAARDRALDAAGLAALLDRTEAEIRTVEAQLHPDDRSRSATVRKARTKRARILAARAKLAAGQKRANLTDPDAVLVKGRQGFMTGYNAQAVTMRLRRPERAGRGARPASSLRIITAVDVVTAADDHGQLLGMVEQAAATTGRSAAVTLADGGYHDGPTLAACAAAGVVVVMPEAQADKLTEPYHKDRFAYDPATDTFTCPERQVLTFRGEKHRSNERVTRVYKAGAEVCRACPAFGVCTRNRAGRSVEIGAYDAELRAHRVWMASEAAQTAYHQRKHLIEPVFGVLKERMDGRRFWLRGLANVQAEWTLVATAVNVRTLVRLWQAGSLEQAA